MERLKLTAPASINSTVQLPSSKSICNRALIINALSGGQFTPDNLSDCDDTSVLIKALREMPPVIDIMAAGTAMRFLTAYLSTVRGEHLITGTQRMQNRPIGILVDALRQLGADIDYVAREGYPPLRIRGRRLDVGQISLPGNVSSQYISALLMIAPVMAHGLELELTGEIVSRPYIDMTLQIMQMYGAVAAWSGAHRLRVEPVPYRPRTYFVESDWSAASYWYEVVALAQAAEVRLPGLFRESLQGDARVASWFNVLGVSTSFEGDSVVLRKIPVEAERLDLDLVEQPDLAQTFVVTACMLGLPFHFTGLQSLKIKETDRISALIAEMRKLGFVIGEARNSELFWTGERCVPALEQGIDTYDDHRMAMAFAPACLKMNHIIINHPMVVTKSYPHFWGDFEQVGFELKKEE